MDDPSRAVARILELMSTLPNARSLARAGDLEGTFDVWFDGGAVKHDTGVSIYRFLDGAEAMTGTSLVWQVSITLPDGRHIHVREDRR